MTHSLWFEQNLPGCPLMAVLRNFTVAEGVELCRRAWELGIRHVEVPIQDQNGEECLAAVVAAGREQGLPVGAGTVDSPRRVHRALELGAAYTVAPGLDEDVVRTSIEAGLPHLPGVATPSEIQRALSLGLHWMKAFPATALGTAWFSAIRGPFPHVRFVATGGLDSINVQSYLDAGVQVAAVGSALQDPQQIDRLAATLTR